MDNKINRREALNIMGLSLAGLAAAGTGLFAVPSCAQKRRKRIIFYFTGTGNSLYIARELADESTELLSIPQMMRQQRFDFEADEIGIVYPIYGHMPPNMVRKFIQKAKLNAAYKFAVLTYGARKCNAVEIWDEAASKAGHKFDYIATIIMVDNWLPNFDMNEQMKIDKHIPENLAKIKAEINEQAHWHEPVTEEERMQHAGFMGFTGLDPEEGFLMKADQCFTVEDSCVQCGICTNVCPRGNYTLGNGGIEMKGDCEFCFACIQNCPQKAIKFKKDSGMPLLHFGEVNPNARYRNEHVSIADLKAANNQL